MKTRKPRPQFNDQPRDGKRNPRAKAKTIARKQAQQRKRTIQGR